MNFAIRRAGHLVLRVTDLELHRRFLEDVLGFRVSGAIGPFFFLTANAVSNHHMIAIRSHAVADGDRMPDPGHDVGMVSVSYEVVDLEDLRQLYGRIQRDGPAFGAGVTDVRLRGAMSTFICADPDGNRLEFYANGAEGDDALLREHLSSATRDGTLARPEPPRIRGTSHLTLRVKDLDRSLQFYEGFLEMSFLGSDAYGRRYLAGTAHAQRPHLALEATEDPDALLPAARAMFGMDHFALELRSFEDLQRAYGRFKETGTAIHHVVDHGVTLSIYFNDPDGNLMEVYHDVPRAEYADPATPFAGAAPLEDRLAV